MDLNIFPINDDKGEILYYAAVERDVTEQKKVAENLTLANQELEEFAYRTSHDLRSPLMSSISLLGISKKEINDNKKEAALDGLEHVEKSLKKLERLVTDILSLTKTKNLEELEEDIAIEDLVKEAIETLSYLDNFDRLSFKTSFMFEQPLKLKKSRMQLIIENLISNAIKYQDITEPSSFVRISTYEQDESFVFEIEDNGLGIPKEQQDKMFKMFQRFHSRVSFGSGLGLYMMKKSADILGAELVFEEAKEKGTVFKVVKRLT